MSMIGNMGQGFARPGSVDWSNWGGWGLGPAGGGDIVVNGALNALGNTTTGIAGAATGAAGAAGFMPTQLGFNIPTAQLALSGLGTIGSLWSAFQANKLAKKAFNFQKDFANTNLRNQTQSYNTQMEDRINSRAVVQGMTADQARSYLDRHQLTLPSSAQPTNPRVRG